MTFNENIFIFNINETLNFKTWKKLNLKKIVQVKNNI